MKVQPFNTRGTLVPKGVQQALVGLLAAALVGLVAHWGGTAKPGPLFWIGVAVLATIIVVFGALAWWLYFSHTDTAPATTLNTRPEIQQFMALVAVTSGILFTMGGLWDENWHKRFGGFGDDFLWPPHFLIYTSIALFTLFAGVGLWVILRGSGSLRSRFRREPLIGLMALVASFLLMSLPSDELWHRVYGIDITAWSLPHLTITIGTSAIMLAAIAVQLTLLPRHEWGLLRVRSWRDALVIVALAIIATMIVLVGVTEWDNRAAGPTDVFTNAFWQRPEWLYPVVVTTVAMFSANLALHVTRQVGAATLVALLMLGARLLARMIFALTWSESQTAYFSFALPLLIAVPLDLWYGFWVLRKRQPAPLASGGNLFAVAVWLTAGLPLIAANMAYPHVNSTTLPPMIIWSVVMALASGWVGKTLGQWVNSIPRADVQRAPISPRWRWATMLALLLICGVVVTIFATAHIPVKS